MKWIHTENTQGLYELDKLGRPIAFVGKLRGIYGMWQKEYRIKIGKHV